jgi:CAAX prenyl protease-like protein
MNNSSTSPTLITPASARAIPFAVFIAFIVLQSVADGWLRSIGMDTRWLYPARTVAVALLLLAFWRHYADLHVFSGVTLGRTALAFIAGMVVFLLWINLDFEWAQVGKLPSFDPTHADGPGLHWVLVGFRVIGLALVVPVMEELFWRSFLLRWLDRHDFLALEPARVSLRATLICALLFASEHNLWLAGLLAGLMYNFVYIRGGNLWLPIVSHATTNGALAWWILATGHWEFW